MKISERRIALRLWHHNPHLWHSVDCDQKVADIIPYSEKKLIEIVCDLIFLLTDPYFHIDCLVEEAYVQRKGKRLGKTTLPHTPSWVILADLDAQAHVGYDIFGTSPYTLFVKMISFC